jgi:hypothetical protein
MPERQRRSLLRRGCAGIKKGPRRGTLSEERWGLDTPLLDHRSRAAAEVIQSSLYRINFVPFNTNNLQDMLAKDYIRSASHDVAIAKPLPEEDFIQMRRLAVKLLSKHLDDTLEKWELDNDITEETYEKLSKEHFRGSSSNPQA